VREKKKRPAIGVQLSAWGGRGEAKRKCRFDCISKGGRCRGVYCKGGRQKTREEAKEQGGGEKAREGGKGWGSTKLKVIFR